MKWLGAAVAVVLSSAPLIPGASAQTGVPLNYAQPLSQAGIATVQQRLKQAGTYTGRTDGVWGGDSATALVRFQRGHGLGECARQCGIISLLNDAHKTNFECDWKS